MFALRYRRGSSARHTQMPTMQQHYLDIKGNLLYDSKTTVFFLLDDKHRVKVGEPGFPVAAAERGRRVLVGRDSAFQVGDHDFTRISIIPSVCFAINIPDSIDSSWYTGRVFVGLKEAVFEPSSPSRHIAELYDIVLRKNLETNPIMLIYMDGGPDHRLTYLKVQLSLISLFLKLDLDFFVCVVLHHIIPGAIQSSE